MTQNILSYYSSLATMLCVAIYDTVALLFLFEPRIGRKKAAALMFASAIALFLPPTFSAGGQNYIKMSIVFGGLETLLSYYLLITCFKGRFWEKTIWLALRDMLDPVFLSTLLFTRLFPGVDFTDTMAHSPRELRLIIYMELFGLVLRALMILLLRYLHGKMRLSDENEKRVGVICLAGYSATGIYLVLRILRGQMSTRGESIVPFVLYSILIAFVVKTIFDALETHDLTRAVKELQGQKQAQYDLFMARLAGDEETRRIRHDIKGHVAVLESLLQQKDYDSALSYLQEFSRQQSLLPAEPPRMDNPVAGALIADKYLRCQEQNIAFSVDGNIERNCGISDVDLVCLLTNLLDNAIESCMRLAPPQRRIYLKVTQRAGCVFIRLENSKTTESVLKEGHLRSTTKANSSRHGLGRRIMLDVLDRYNGTVDLQETEDTFSAVVMLQPNKVQQEAAEPQLSE